ncbi:3-oxoacyl-ACP reductase [Pseudoroseicyclus aestuarii]|uniref:3-oxoacyl-[acyl-carrier protein] reductase n=1 Tax=Pseudoroseicyclus aestuarii TaxID=1795041 RepID=A0A318STR1_9RHOB|nr:3-oxoacyl-ACP reductase [Pseudoroseicyclus aestuarii]PYE85351.1 3-oxoacyl-[acyl-carrier protein] reductase [Pseudoroseicyclus aestuarii]
MSRPIKDQTVLVTGAGRGLGAAIAAAFAREGAAVVVNYRSSRDAAEGLAARLGDRVIALQADVRDPEAVAQMLRAAEDRLGPVTTVVNNALADFRFNGDARKTLAQISPAEMTAQHETAVLGALTVLQAAAPGMEAAGFGRIVSIGTNLFQNPVVPYHDYTAAKAALLALTRTAAAELGPKRITVNMVSGGLLRTTDASAATPESVFDYIAGATPLRSVTTPEELADAVLFFASPWARAVTGQNLIVDGGLVPG